MRLGSVSDDVLEKQKVAEWRHAHAGKGLLRDDEVGDVVVALGFEAADLGEREPVEPLVRGVVAVGLVEVDGLADGRVPQVVVTPREEEHRVLAPTDEDGREELASLGTHTPCQHEPVARDAPDVRDAVGRDDLELDALDDLDGQVAAEIVSSYAKDHIDKHQRAVEHSQHLLCGQGFWQIGDPPWLPRMEKLGFRRRWGAESFFIEHDWARLPAIFDHETGEPISNVAYNESYGLPRRYLTSKPTGDTSQYLSDRVPEVIRLSRDARAKLQYFQAMFDFV